LPEARQIIADFLTRNSGARTERKCRSSQNSQKLIHLKNSWNDISRIRLSDAIDIAPEPDSVYRVSLRPN
jgi:hypothetical protein